MSENYRNELSCGFFSSTEHHCIRTKIFDDAFYDQNKFINKIENITFFAQ